MSETEKALQAARAYKKEWRRKNKDKVRESNARYWAKKAAELEAQERTATTHS